VISIVSFCSIHVEFVVGTALPVMHNYGTHMEARVSRLLFCIDQYDKLIFAPDKSTDWLR